MKQETLEEAAERLFGKHFNGMHYDDISDKHIIKYGLALAKWQQEQNKKLYSEEEVVQLLQKVLTHKDDGEIGNLVTAQKEIRTANFHSWFNTIKKQIRLCK
jgi:hypothetical protein